MSDTTRLTKIAAHRGGAGLWAENSMIAFDNTTRMDVDFIEFDVHPTRDGEIVVFHDPTLDRMTDGSGPITDCSFDELQALRINGTENERIPLLIDVIKTFQDTAIDLRLEIKGNAEGQRYRGIEQDVARILEDNGAIEGTVISSFFVDSLTEFQKFATPRHVLWLIKREVIRQIGGIEAVLHIAKQNGIEEIGLHRTDLGQREVDACRQAGIRLGAYAVNDAESIQQMYDYEITVFTTNFPDIALGIL